MTEDIDLIRVTGVEYVKDYTMRLEFSNGKLKLVNFLPLLKGKLFEPLKDLRNFVQFGLTHWTLEWYNGADFAPDYLYRNGGGLKEPPLYGTKITIIRNNETFPIRQEIRVEKVKVDYTAALLNRKILKNYYFFDIILHLNNIYSF